MSDEDDFQSNRPYTLFYYPSSRLQPRAMSEDQVCEVWCLMDREQEPFFLEASLRWNMDQLKKAIRQEKYDLRNLEISQIVLRKVRLSD